MTKGLSTGGKVLFGSGTGAIAAFNTLRQLFFAIFLTDAVGIDARLASGVALIGLGWDVVAVPLIGGLTDRGTSRWGRRRPFLIAGAVPAGLAFILLWWAPTWESQAALTAHVVVAWVVAHTLQSLVVVPYLALIPEVAPDYDSRTSLTAYRMVFSILVSLVVAVTAPMLLDTAVAQGQSSAAGHLTVATAFAVLSAIIWLAIGLWVPEQPAQPVAERTPILVAARQTWRNGPFRAAAGLYLLTWTAFDLVAMMMPFYLVYHVSHGDLLATVNVLGTPVARESVVLGTLLLAAIPAVPVWSWLATRYDKRTAFLLGAGVWLVAQIGLGLMPEGQVGWTIALAAFAGAGVATAHVIPDAIFPDTVEFGEWMTGRRTEGAYYAMQDLLRKAAAAIALFLALQGLGWSGYAPPPVGVTVWTVSEATHLGILWLTGPIGALLLLGAMGFAWVYPLTRSRMAEIRQELDGNTGE